MGRNAVELHSETSGRSEPPLDDDAHLLSLALAAARAGAWEWQPASGRMRWSQAAHLVTGVAPDALDAGARLFRHLVHVDDLDGYMRADRAMRAGQPFTAKYRLRQPDGRWRWIHVLAIVERDANGTAQRVVGVFIDVSARRLAQQRSDEMQQELRQRLAQRLAQIERMNTAFEVEMTERSAAEGRVRELRAQLLSVEEDERRRISRDLHDTLGQHLSVLTIGLKAAQAIDACPPEMRERLGLIQRALVGLEEDVDRISHELRPPVLDDLGLEHALRHHALAWSSESGIAVDVHTHGLRAQRLSTELETTVYRVVQEALTNVRKHADASRVSVIVEQRGRQLSAIVEDDGCGFDVAALASASGGRRRLGLKGMSERAELVGGRLQIEAAPGEGTTVYVTIPLESCAGAEAADG